MHPNQATITRPSESVLATNRVLRNTYILLSLTLIFSAMTAGVAMLTNAQPSFILIFVAYGLLFLTQATSQSVWGLVSTFAFTGVLGYTLGPMLNMIVGSYANGAQIIMTALGATGIIFFGLSGYAMTTRKDFSYLSGFLAVGVLTVFIAMIANIFLNIPAFHLMISAAFVLLSSGIILFQTSMIINGGERNYIMATISLYVALYNLFVSLLHLLSAFGGRD